MIRNRNRCRGTTVLAVLAMTALFQAQSQTVFRVPVRVVEVPATVTSPGGKMLRDLRPEDFTLADNGKSQKFHLDESGETFSLVIAIQTNAAARAWLPEVSHSASAIEALILGAKGRAAVLSFDDDVSLLSETAADTAALDKAFGTLHSSGERSRCLDAVLKAAEILRQAPPDARRILLLIAQPGDAGSKASLRDALAAVERDNITVYALGMPRVGKDLLSAIRVGGLSSPGGRDTGFIVSADLAKLVPEIYRASKSAAGEDALSLLTAYTGGLMAPFRKRNDLDAAIGSLGEQLHTGYLLTYTPSDPAIGYHRIQVTASGNNDIVRARPGYYVNENELAIERSHREASESTLEVHENSAAAKSRSGLSSRRSSSDPRR